MTFHRIPPQPLPYRPEYEVTEAGELETQTELLQTLQGISETTFKDSGHATRSVHAKSHGLLRGTLQVLDDLPEVLAQGLFARSATFPVVMRLSTIPGDILDDRVSTPRGLAIKVIGVDGERLDGSEGDHTQDFVLVNGPVFASPGPKKFLSSLKLLATTTDKVPNLKLALSAVLRGTERAVEALGGESGTLKALGGHPITHILGESFFSQAPVLFGRYMAKIAVVPVAPALQRLTGAPVDLHHHPNGLREAVVDYFATQAAEWELRVQLCTNLDSMPIEDASVEWPESESPYIAVARLAAPAQLAWSAARAAAIDDGMAFSPWHGITAHRPIGAVMRVRKLAYQMSAQFRAKHGGRAMREPASLDELPD